MHAQNNTFDLFTMQNSKIINFIEEGENKSVGDFIVQLENED